jgi:DNA-binding NarL/FixJ family response regulator
VPDIRVLIADSKPLFGEAVRAELEAQPDVSVIGLATDGMQAVAQARMLIPDVVVLDVNVPNGDGVRATRLIVDETHASVLLVADDEDEELLLEAVHAGAAGYVSRGAPLGELIEGVRGVARGDVAIPREMLPGLIRGLVRRRRDQEVALRVTSVLTRREREILAMLSEGADNDRIAQVLVISPQTVRTHTQNILRKLGVHSRLEAAAFVLRNGIREELAGAVG